MALREPFKEEDVKRRWREVDGRCECRAWGNSAREENGKACTNEIRWEARGQDGDTGGWEAHLLASNHPHTYTGLSIQCMDCHLANNASAGHRHS